MRTEIKVDEHAMQTRRPNLVGKQEVPFVDNDGNPVNIRCIHAKKFTVLTQQDGNDAPVAILGMANDQHGLFIAYTAEEIRAMITQLGRMVDHMDSLSNGKR